MSKGDVILGLLIFGPTAIFLYAGAVRNRALMSWSILATGAGFLAVGVALLTRGVGWTEGPAPGILGLMGARRRVHPVMLLAVGVVLLGLGGYLLTLV